VIENLPIVVIACKVFKDYLEHYLPDGLKERITFMDYGLHSVPRNLNMALQDQIDANNETSLIVMGYGLCGNGLHGIKSGKHYILVPRADDCIAILLGSYPAYLREFNKEPATYYLSKGWLESGSNPLQEYQKYVAKYGEEQAAWLMDQQYRNYHRLVLVAHQPQDLEKYRSQALQVAEFCQRWGMHYEEILGSTEYVEQLTAIATSRRAINEEFILIEPGDELRQGHFIRK
jgi:hypothetical protein